jgi:hypothetical protein
VTDDWSAASPAAQELAAEYYEIDLAEMLVTARAANARVRALADQWVKAGPPPLGTSVSRWWDARLIELNTALADPKDQT